MDPEFARQTRIWFPEPSFRKSRKKLALPGEEFSRMIQWLTGHAFLRLQNFRADSSVTPISVCRYCSRHPERADHIILKCVRLRLLQAECFGPWDLSRTRPEWELSQVLKFLDSPKILALEDQEQEARNLDFWEPTDSEDADQHDDGPGQPLPPPAVPQGTHDIST